MKFPYCAPGTPQSTEIVGEILLLKKLELETLNATVVVAASYYMGLDVGPNLSRA